jgi:geranylgeranyl diphosphate synthase type I
MPGAAPIRALNHTACARAIVRALADLGAFRPTSPLSNERRFPLLTLESFQRVDELIDAEINALLDDAADAALPTSEHDVSIYDLMRYHLGQLDQSLARPLRANPGKRVRPKLCLASCEAAGSDATIALPIAAAIELLHNFTLIHDDIQDESETRRGRPTVWHVWGAAQAINAGDAMFAIAQLGVQRLRERGVAAEQALDLARELNRTTLHIVEGQTLDLAFEHRQDVTVDEYLTMIHGKTAAIIGFAAWAGATLAGAESARADAYRAFGLALGLGFQIQDDLLGVWGALEITGKSAADDIRRGKKSFPILLLIERADASDRRMLRALYAEGALAESEVDIVLALLDRYAIRPVVEAEVLRRHDEAQRLLDDLKIKPTQRVPLEGYVAELARRTA